MNPKFSFLKIIIIILVLGLLTIALASFFSERQNRDESLSPEDSESSKLMNDNQTAIQSAAAFSGYLKPIDQADHTWGNPDSSVKIVVYTDFECPFCARFYRTMEEVKSEFGDDVLTAVRHYPLSSHFDAMDLALASECAGEQAKFWEIYSAFFEAENLSSASIDEIAKKLELDFVAFKKCFSSGKYNNLIYLQKAEARNAGVLGAPTVFVNDEIYPGAIPFEDYQDNEGNKVEGMKSIISRHLAK